MRSGDLFLEASLAKQATALINLQKLAHLDVTVAPDTNLNFSRGVISPADFLNVSTEEIKENMQAQKVCDVRRITIRRDGQNTKPVTGAWPVMPLRRTDVKLTRLRIGHTRFTHRHLLFGERAPECPSCHVSYTVHHILIDCPVFNHHRITFFHKSVLTLSDLVGESPHQNLFAFMKKIGFLYFI
ncbi:RNase H domain-containing protein [Trichonephila clavipes]|nr:RNase H domain-containing protein [Trichonephila clavipes]